MHSAAFRARHSQVVHNYILPVTLLSEAQAEQGAAKKLAAIASRHICQHTKTHGGVRTGGRLDLRGWPQAAYTN